MISPSKRRGAGGRERAARTHIPARQLCDSPRSYVLDLLLLRMCRHKYCIVPYLIPLFTFFLTQGVMKSRKRATFMVVTVSFLFGICWGTESVEFFLRAYTSLDISSLHVAIADTMVVFNSALNPFIFALMNHQFKEKIKRMFICDNPTMARIHAAENLKMIQLNKQPTNNIATQYLSHSNFPWRKKTLC